MKYIGHSGEDPIPTQRVAVLLTNLGTPDNPDRRSLRRYLKEFLWDPRVIEVPRPIWWLILNLIILNIRPSRSAAAYREVWTERGSPLLYHTQDQACALQRRLGPDVLVDFAMRYGNPSIPERIQRLMERGVEELLVLPMYPQYAGPTTASTFDRVAEDLVLRRRLPGLRLVRDYHDFKPYIEALACSIETHWETHPRADCLLLSYHGEPQRYVDQGDPYYDQCLQTSELLACRLGLDETEYQVTFQSRFGREPWLQPYTDKTLQALPGEGVKSVQILCPGFSSDCLETIEEIGMENRDYFLEAGGERFEYIPCLNSSGPHIEALAQLVEHHLGDWHDEDRDRTRITLV